MSMWNNDPNNNQFDNNNNVNESSNYTDNDPIVTVSKEKLERASIEVNNKMMITRSIVGIIAITPIIYILGRSIFLEQNRAFVPFIAIFVILLVIILMMNVSNLIRAINSNKINKYNEDILKNMVKSKDAEAKYNTSTKMVFNFQQLYIIVFGIFWFGFLIVADYMAIKSWDEGGSQNFIYSLIFWIAGIFAIGKRLKTK